MRPLGVLGTNRLPNGGAIGAFDPMFGTGRRGYPFSSGNFASPNYIDSPGWSWGGNPYAGRFVLQMRYTMDRFEGINGPFANHVYALGFDGVQAFRVNNDVASVFRDTGWFDVGNGAVSSITFHDWADGSGAGGTAFVGNVILYYQWRYP